MFFLLATLLVISPTTKGFSVEPSNPIRIRRCLQSPPNHLSIVPIQQAHRFSKLTNGYQQTSTSQAGSFMIEEFVASPAVSTARNDALLLWNQIQPFLSKSLLATLPTSMISSPFCAKLTSSLQRLGEESFLALLTLAVLQGFLAMVQYRTNPSGELMVPPGLTIGVEMPEAGAGTSSKFDQPPSLEIAANITELFTLEMMNTDSSNDSPSLQTTILNRLNGLLVVLLPWLASRANFILQRNSHLLHIGSILTLTSVFDVPQSFLLNKRRPTSGNSTMAYEGLSFSKGASEHVVVIGDSLAIGLGSVDHFDINKTNDWPFQRIENTGDPEHMSECSGKPGPAFPKSLAHILANKLQKPVTWRSAGVDGGDVPKVKEYCLGVIEEEVHKGRVPDVICLLCGANDMKYFLSNPFSKSTWPRSFRSNLAGLVKEIKAVAPEATIILPAMPTQMFHKNSPANVFPLGALVDTMAAFWDSQVRLVADGFASRGVQYIGLTPQEINLWYQETSFNDDGAMDMSPDGIVDKHLCCSPITLIAKDGVHPNARCYANWATAIGKKLIANLSGPPSEPGPVPKIAD